jgi:hypothetical protein
MKEYPVYRLSQAQDEYGSKEKTWTADGTIRAMFNPSAMDGLEAQGLVLREHESILLTVDKTKLVAGEHRVVIGDHKYDITHVPAARGRLLRVVVSAVTEGLHERF